MRRTKLTCWTAAFGLACLIVLMSSGIASATVLCETETGPTCGTKGAYPAGTALSASLASTTTATIVSTLGTVKCPKSTIAAKTEKEEGEPLAGKVNEWSFAECKLEATACTVTAEKTPYPMSIAYTAENKGTFTVSESQFTLVCGGFIKCKFSGEGKVELLGGNPATLIAKEMPLKLLEGGLCPKTGTFTATYEFTSPAAGQIIVAQIVVPTKLCKVAPTNMGGVLKCLPATEIYSGEAKGKLEAGQNATFQSIVGATGTVTCNEATYVGKFNADGTPQNPGGGITSFVAKNAGTSCTSTLANTPPVKVEFKNFPWDVSRIIYRGQVAAPQGSMSFTATAAEVEMQMVVEKPGEFTTCLYEKFGKLAEESNAAGAESKLGVTGTWRFTTETPVRMPVVCPRTLQELARMTFERTGNVNLFVARE